MRGQSTIPAIFRGAMLSCILAAGPVFAADDKLAYGEYLSGECVTCHHPSGEDKGIPSIIGWPRGYFVRVMREYRGKRRPNPTMQIIAAGLDDEQIAALATYFGSIKKPKN